MSTFFYITREDSKVVANFSTGLPHEEHGKQTLIDLSIDVKHVYLAELLAQHLRATMNNAISAARREAYEQGWKDAKAHKAKRDYFSPWLER